MRGASQIFLAAVLAVLVAVSAYLLLPACGVWAPLGGMLGRSCPEDAALANVAALRVAEARNVELDRAVSGLERRLALLHCPPVPVVAPPPPPPVPEPEPEPEPEIDREAWESGDLGLLEGCWRLDSEYLTQNDRTGEIQRYDDWRLCFGANGAGTETMRSTDGMTCEGPISGVFVGDRLSVTEPDNLACSNGGFIYQRTMTCRLLDDGGAACVSEQAQRGTRNEVRLRRMTGAQ